MKRSPYQEATTVGVLTGYLFVGAAILGGAVIARKIRRDAKKRK